MPDKSDNEIPVLQQMTKQEYRRYLIGATLTAICMGLVISAGIVLFVLYCVHVWL